MGVNFTANMGQHSQFGKKAVMAVRFSFPSKVPGKEVAVKFHQLETPKTSNPVTSKNETSYGVSKTRDTPKSSILIGFSIINHPFWGVSLFLETPKMFSCFPGTNLRKMTGYHGFDFIFSSSKPPIPQKNPIGPAWQHNAEPKTSVGPGELFESHLFSGKKTREMQQFCHPKNRQFQKGKASCSNHPFF